MRGWWVISVLALAGCGVNQGSNPNYQFGPNRYGEYRAEREVALMTGEESPQTIPVALPVEAPTAGQIAGQAPVPPPPTMGVPTPAKSTTVAPVAGSAATLPVTSGGPYPGSTPVLVRYAFAVSHDPGTAVYRRSGGSASVAARVCAGYPNPDAAQTAFLAAGGPQQDPRGMDPDGDGFVCSWNPEPFRQSQL